MAQKRFFVFFLASFCLVQQAKAFDLNAVFQDLPAPPPPKTLPAPPSPNLSTIIRPPEIESRKLPDTVGSTPTNSKEAPFPSINSAIGSAKSERPQSVPIEAFPWTAGLSLRNAPDAVFCGAVVVNKNWLLTAAYCLDESVRGGISGGDRRNAILVIAGSPNSKTSSAYDVAQIIIHPDWHRGNFANDIALLRISGEFTKPISGLSLDGPPADQQVGAIGQVVGWGITNLEVPPTQDLQLIPTRVLAKEVCSGVANYATRLVVGKFCAQSLLANFDACQGFGGAGLILTDPVDHRRYLGGIVSSGDGCPPLSHKPTIYSDTLQQASWIKSIIEGGAK
jgi:secreted trypsin-like serine protease